MMASSVESKTPRLLCVVPSLGPGGAEHVMCRLVNHWAAQGHEVILATLEPHVEDFFATDPAVKRIGVAPPRIFGAKTVGRAVQALGLRRAVRNLDPDVIVTFQRRTSILGVLASWGTETPVVISDRNDPRGRPSARWKDLTANMFLRRADVIVVQNEGIASWARAALPGVRVAVITNAVLPARITKDHAETKKTVVAMGRLHRQKGFDLLLHAFVPCAAHHPDWKLTILGDGEERSALTALIQHLGLCNSVEIVGFVKDPEPYLATSDIFVFSSRWEGFGLALAEAMACGLPVVSFDCLSGPAELIRDGYDGILVPPGDVSALTKAMMRLISEPGLRRTLGNRARLITQRFSPEQVFKEWDALLSGLPTRRTGSGIEQPR